MADKADQIKALVDLMSQKQTFTFRNYITSTNEYIFFQTPIELNQDRHYEAALVYMDVYNSLKNITTNNNNFYYATTQSANPAWKTITFPPGAYEFKDINSYIQLRIRTNEALAAGADDPITISVNETLNRTDIKIISAYSVDFTQPNSLIDLFGFDSITIKANGTTTGTKNIKVMAFNTVVISRAATKVDFLPSKVRPFFRTKVRRFA